MAGPHDERRSSRTKLHDDRRTYRLAHSVRQQLRTASRAVRCSIVTHTRDRAATGKNERTIGAQAGIDPSELATQQGVEMLAGNRLAEGSEPLAMAYAGHQFGGFVPQLGVVAPSCSERLSTGMAQGATSNSRAPGRRHFHVKATAALRSVRYCVNTSLVKRWRPLASRRHAPLAS